MKMTIIFEDKNNLMERMMNTMMTLLMLQIMMTMLRPPPDGPQETLVCLESLRQASPALSSLKLEPDNKYLVCQVSYLGSNSIGFVKNIIICNFETSWEAGHHKNNLLKIRFSKTQRKIETRADSSK